MILTFIHTIGQLADIGLITPILSVAISK